MEDVIVGLLFVYFFVIRPILKQARKAAPKGEAGEQAKPQGRRKKVSLSELFAKAQKKLQEAAEQVAAEKRARAEQARAPKETSWQDLFAGPAPEPQPSPEPWGTREPEGWAAEARPEPQSRGWEWEPEEMSTVSREEATEPLPEEPRAAPGAIPVRRVSWGRADLRKAVIWSEILGPPVSLREDGTPGRL